MCYTNRKGHICPKRKDRKRVSEMNNIAIYRKIEEIIQREGRLPEDFTPEAREAKEGELLFAPGAMEGILGHHSSGKGEKTAFVPVLKQYVKISLGAALQDFEANKADTFKVATMRGSLLQEIMNHRVELDPNKVANLAYCFAANGRKAETVKLGLTMLSLFNFSDNPQVCHMLKTLGYCEDFTDYVLMSIENWPDKQKQDCYFELARKLYGWGKINVVEMLEADTEEKKQWLLCHGCENSILNAYLGLVCAEKADLFERLQKGNLSAEELRGATKIMDGLLDEGPCAGMSAIEHPVVLTLLYLKEVEQMLKSGVSEEAITYVAACDRINDYFGDKDTEIVDASKVCEKIQEIIDALDVDSLLAAGLKDYTWQSIQVANLCGRDVSGKLLELMKEDFNEYYRYCNYFFQKECMVEEFVALCEEKAEAVSYSKGMGNLMGLKLGEGQVALDMTVQYLDRYPLLGQKLVEICMDSPIIRWRNVAAKALLGWVEKLNKPLQEIAPELYAKVMTLNIVEVNKNTKEQWSKLI